MPYLEQKQNHFKNIPYECFWEKSNIIYSRKGIAWRRVLVSSSTQSKSDTVAPSGAGSRIDQLVRVRLPNALNDLLSFFK